MNSGWVEGVSGTESAKIERLIDSFGRRITYVRLSVTDRCDLRCRYCMAERMQFLPKRDILTLEELAALSNVLIARGVRKIRLTGGEPLVRKGVMELVRMLGKRVGSGLDELVLTTNGTRLERFAGELRDAGVKRIRSSFAMRFARAAPMKWIGCSTSFSPASPGVTSSASAVHRPCSAT